MELVELELEVSDMVWMLVSYSEPTKATQWAQPIVYTIFDGDHEVAELPLLMLVTKYKSNRH